MGDQDLHETMARVREKADRLRELEFICAQMTDRLAAVVEAGVPTAEDGVEEVVGSEDVGDYVTSPHLAREQEVSFDFPVRVNRECKQLVKSLKRKVEVLEGELAQRDRLITMLRAENRQKTAELLEHQQQKLQQAVCEKDSLIAVLELQPNCQVQTEKMKKEREKLKAQLKDKVKQRSKLLNGDSEESTLLEPGSYQGCTKKELCTVLRALGRDSARLKAYIDQLIALVLERNTDLLEGMPRTQQSTGMGLDLLEVASLPELAEELQERERDSQILQEYVSLLLQRITDKAPELLHSIMPPKHIHSLCST